MSDQPNLTEIQSALQAVGDAVSRDDKHEYLHARNRARELGCTVEQVEDAYRYRRELRRKVFKRDPSFDVNGNPLY
jgi:hypothetical protein